MTEPAPRVAVVVFPGSNDDRDDAQAQVQRMCSELLANPLIESFEIRLADG